LDLGTFAAADSIFGYTSVIGINVDQVWNPLYIANNNYPISFLIDERIAEIADLALIDHMITNKFFNIDV